MTVPAELFAAHLDESARASLPATHLLDDLLRTLLAAGRAAWPAIVVSDGDFVIWIAERLPGRAGVAEELAQVHAADLYLACACSRGDAAAIAAFDRGHLGAATPALARMGLSADTVAEVRQRVRQRLLVAEPGQAPRIADYAGRGDLRNWVRATCVRTALNLIRADRQHGGGVSDDERILATFPAADDDPELAHMKGLYRGEFRRAFADALAALSDREQTLLRLYHVDDLTIDDVGAIYRIHRVTALRWINKAREALVARTRDVLGQRLRVDPVELDSIMRLIRSQLDISVAAYFRDLRDK